MNQKNNKNDIPKIMKNIEENLENFSDNKSYSTDDQDVFMLDKSFQENEGVKKNFEITSEKFATFKSIIQKIVSEELDRRNK